MIDPERICMGCMQEKDPNERCPRCGFDETSYAASPHHLPPRAILAGKYLVGRVLGEGGFGITYLGWDLNLDVKVAVKEFYPAGFVTRENRSGNTVFAYAGDKAAFFASGRDRFVDEAKALAKFYGLPGIVAVKDFFLENNTAYIVMEFVEGENLKEMLVNAGGSLPAVTVLEMMKPLMRSLEEIHKAGIIHRDISPDNIMVTKTGDVKLLDFGAARNFENSGNRSISVLLKPGYAPEEQYRTRGVQGPWTDVYALCATIYRAITGVTPPESVERLRADELKAPSEMGVRITPAEERALLKGMAVLQTERYQSVQELYEAFFGQAGGRAAGADEKTRAKQESGAKNTAGGAGQTASGAQAKKAAEAKPKSPAKPLLIRIAAGAAALIIVAFAGYCVWAASTGSYGEDSLIDRMFSSIGVARSARANGGSSGSDGTKIALASTLGTTAADGSAAFTAVPNDPDDSGTPAPKATATPTVTPAATPTAMQKRNDDSAQTSAPRATSTPKQATATPKITATPTVKPTATSAGTPKPAGTSTPILGPSTSWSNWVTKLPAGVSSPAYSIESKNQYRTVYYNFSYEETMYNYDFGDGTSSGWTNDASLCGTYPYETRQDRWFATTYGSWTDGDAAKYMPSLDDLDYYEGVDTRTLYRYKLN